MESLTDAQGIAAGAKQVPTTGRDTVAVNVEEDIMNFCPGPQKHLHKLSENSVQVSLAGVVDT